MIHFTGLYRYTDQLSVWYVLSCTKHTNTWYMGADRHTAHTDPFSDWYVSPVLSGMLRYDESWFKSTKLKDI